MSDDLFDLNLIRQDKISNILFLIGTLIALYTNYKEEQEIVRSVEKQTFNKVVVTPAINLSDLLIEFNLLFLIGSIIIANTASARINKQELDINKDISVLRTNNLTGSKIILFGICLRIAGYILGVVGNKIRADNPV